MFFSLFFRFSLYYLQVEYAVIDSQILSSRVVTTYTSILCQQNLPKLLHVAILLCCWNFPCTCMPFCTTIKPYKYSIHDYTPICLINFILMWTHNLSGKWKIYKILAKCKFCTSFVPCWCNLVLVFSHKKHINCERILHWWPGVSGVI